MNKIYNIDCIKGMQNLEPNSIDLIVTDPPYFASRKEFIQNITSFNEYVHWFETWIKEAKRVLKSTGSIYVFLPVHDFAEIHLLIKKYFTAKQFISWIKPNTMIRVFQNRNYFPKTEFIGFYTVDNAKYTWNRLFKKFGVNNSCNYIIEPIVYWNSFEGVEHSTQKPVNIVSRFVYASSNPGDIVLDPFVGSGTTCVAAKQLERRYIGFEINQDYIEIANNRLLHTCTIPIEEPISIEEFF